MHLVIDIGNTAIKYAFFEKIRLIKVGKLESEEELRRLLAEGDFDQAIIGSVRKGASSYLDAPNHGKKITVLDHNTPLPIALNYDTPETLGMDRVAAAVGAFYQFPESAVMVIDIGTCITYDFLDVNGQFHGGAISPGVDLRYKALNDYTAKLPLVEDKETNQLIGKSTRNAIKSGVLNGTLAEIEGMIGEFMLKAPDLKVIVTGGGAKTFEKKIKAGIFVALEIVLYGLNRVLIYNGEYS